MVVDTRLDVSVNELTYPMVAKPNVVELSAGATDERYPIVPRPKIVDVMLVLNVAVDTKPVVPKPLTVDARDVFR